MVLFIEMGQTQYLMIEPIFLYFELTRTEPKFFKN